MSTTLKHGSTSSVIKTLESFLSEANAHVTFEEAVKDIPARLLGVIPEKLPYSIWQLVEHIRITQWDILEFSKGPDHKSPRWPDEYWPKETAPAVAGDWEKALKQIAADRKTFIALLRKAGEEIHTPFSYGDGQTLFREAILIVDHTSYHTGEIVAIRRLLGCWR